MPYALYIDESGDFTEGESLQAVRSSLVAGWIAPNDDDHDELRIELTQWYAQVEQEIKQKKYHATEWRKESKKGPELLEGVSDLAVRHNPYAIVSIENKTKSSEKDSDATYLDMLVELIVSSLFLILEDRKDKDAFPLQVYVAERKGQPDWEIRQLVRYRFRALLAGSKYARKAVLNKAFNIHLRPLNRTADFLQNSQSRNRSEYGLMPELILADFLCNSFFQMNDLKTPPNPLKTFRWDTAIFVQDPFWRDLQILRKQKRWVEIILEMTSSSGRIWPYHKKPMKKDYDKLLEEAFNRTLTNLQETQQLLTGIEKAIRHNRDWLHAGTIIQYIKNNDRILPSHLRPLVQWNINQYSLMIANHMGDNNEASRIFEQLRGLLATPDYQRTEFIGSIPDFYNRHAVSITDNYDFDKAEEIIRESIEVEKQLIGKPFEIQGQLYSPKYSDTLGRLYSTFGQLRTKQAVRNPSLIREALELFDKAETHMQQSLDAPRQRNYRIEAYLTAKNPEYSDKILKLLSGEEDIGPGALFKSIRPHSYDMMYWLRWMALPGNNGTEPYREELMKDNSAAFLDMTGKAYPAMSCLYYFGQIAWSCHEQGNAINAWQKASEVGVSFNNIGVLQTLALRPLCELAIKAPAESPDAKKAVLNILNSIRNGNSISRGYFEKYFVALQDEDITDSLLEELRDDIPYS